MYRESEKNLLNSNTSSTCPHNMVNFGTLTASLGTPANFIEFRVLATLLHGTRVVGVSQSLRRWTQGATYIRKGGHHVGHWPTFLVTCKLLLLHFAWVLWSRASVCLSVRCRMPTLLHGPGCHLSQWYPLVVHYWADLQLVRGLRCNGNITRTRNVSEYMLVLALCLV